MTMNSLFPNACGLWLNVNNQQFWKSGKVYKGMKGKVNWSFQTAALMRDSRQQFLSQNFLDTIQYAEKCVFEERFRSWFNNILIPQDNKNVSKHRIHRLFTVKIKDFQGRPFKWRLHLPLKSSLKISLNPLCLSVKCEHNLLTSHQLWQGYSDKSKIQIKKI